MTVPSERLKALSVVSDKDSFDVNDFEVIEMARELLSAREKLEKAAKEIAHKVRESFTATGV